MRVFACDRVCVRTRVRVRARVQVSVRVRVRVLACIRHNTYALPRSMTVSPVSGLN